MIHGIVWENSFPLLFIDFWGIENLICKNWRSFLNFLAFNDRSNICGLKILLNCKEKLIFFLFKNVYPKALTKTNCHFVLSRKWYTTTCLFPNQAVQCFFYLFYLTFPFNFPEKEKSEAKKSLKTKSILWFQDNFFIKSERDKEWSKINKCLVALLHSFYSVEMYVKKTTSSLGWQQHLLILFLDTKHSEMKCLSINENARCVRMHRYDRVL